MPETAKPVPAVSAAPLTTGLYQGALILTVTSTWGLELGLGKEPRLLQRPQPWPFELEKDTADFCSFFFSFPHAQRKEAWGRVGTTTRGWPSFCVLGG